MKYLKKPFAVILLAVLFCSSISAAGDASDPVISQSYLESVFSGEFLKEVSSETKAATDALEAEALQEIEYMLAKERMSNEQRHGYTENGSGTLYSAGGDRVSVVLGTKITAIEGSITVSDGWVDITVGERVKKGTPLSISHTYISTGDECYYTTTTVVACVSFNGSCTINRSGNVDYGSRAQALAALGLFKGGTTGFELTRAATRTEALVMFLRILGLEDEAQITSARNPFWDIPAWAVKYAAYAYAQGLAQGRGNGTYDANTYVTAQDYLTFLMRALGYRENTDFSWATAMDDAVSLRLITNAERDMLKKTTFTRAQMVYLSWQALMCQNSEGQLLLCQLRDEGTISRIQVAAAITSVCGSRIS